KIPRPGRPRLPRARRGNPRPPTARPTPAIDSTWEPWDYSPAVWRDLILVATVLAADRTSLPLQPGRTTNVVVSAAVGAPLERAVPSKFYAQAAAADGE